MYSLDGNNNSGDCMAALVTRLAAFLLAALVAPTVDAGNGLNLIGFGTESTMMGGADVAVSRDTTALNTNPAGLARLQRPAFDVYAASAYALDVGHRDPLNDVNVSNQFISLGGFGYSRPLGVGDVTVGLGTFVQGGAGNKFNSVNTGFGNNDELSALFGILKFSAGAAWQATEKLALGASVAAIYSRVEQRVFPNTSVVAPAPFFGLQLRGVDGINPGFRFGAQYKFDERWLLGATFAPKAKLTMDGGSAVVNMNAAGMGLVTYRDVRISGLALPREVAVGASWQATDRTLLAVKLEWLNWADALKTSTLTLSSPDQAGAPPVIVSPAALDWKNQTVIAFGIAHKLDDRTTLRAGFNYGANPMPVQTTSTLLAAIAEKHITAGISHRFDGGWEFGGGLEYQPGVRVSYSNPQAPLGVGAEERNNYIAAHAMLSRRW
jgi:long-chain fatty acid transport protein